MGQYQLNFTIDAAGVSQINQSGQLVTIVKSVSPAGTGGTTVAWLAFAPLEQDIVTWDESYFIYATTTEIESGATITMTSVTADAVVFDQVYTLESGAFSGAPGGTSDTYVAQNSNGGTLSFGLSQQANVNGTTVTAPINAIPVLNNETVSFTPEVTVTIFLSNVTNNGVVISDVYSTPLTVTLTSTAPAANIGFIDENNTFYQIGQTGAVNKTPLYKRFSAPARR